MQFTPGIVDVELPENSSLALIGGLGPGLGLSLKGR